MNTFRSVPLRHVARILGGGTPSLSSANWGGNIPFITPKDLRKVDGTTVGHTERTLTVDGVKTGSRIAPAGSLILSIRAPIGYCALLDKDSAFSQGCKTLVPNQGLIRPRFLLYWLASAREMLTSRANGTTFMELSSESLASSIVELPNLESQDRIVEFLDAELEQIDAFVAVQERLMALLSERRVALADVIMESIEADLVKLRFLFAPRNERANGDEEVLSVYRDYGVIPKNSRSDNHNVTPEDLSSYRRVTVGDLVVNKMKAWQGSVAISDFEGIVSGDYQVLRPITTRFSSQFAHHILRSSRMIREYRIRSKGIRPSQWRLYWEDLADIRVPVPDLPVQESIERRFVDIAEQDPVGESLESLRQLLEERRAALITAAVTGELEV